MIRDEKELAGHLATLGLRAREAIKGLSARVIVRFHGENLTYMLGGSDGESWVAEPVNEPKSPEDWKCLVYAQGSGALVGRMTGKVHFKGSSGFLEEDKSIMFVHQLLPASFARIASRCAYPVPVLAARAALLARDPVRASGALFLQSYLRAVYRAAAGAELDLLLSLIEELPGESDPRSILAALDENEAALKKEKKNVVPAFEDGRIRIFYKEGKTKVLINGWIWGEEQGGGAEDHGPAKEHDLQYDRIVRDAAFPIRMNALLDEAARLLGPDSADLIQLVADHKDGRLAKILSMVEHFAEKAEGNMLDPSFVPAARGVLEQYEAYQKTVSRFSRAIEAAGVDLEPFKPAHVAAIHLKRKLSIL